MVTSLASQGEKDLGCPTGPRTTQQMRSGSCGGGQVADGVIGAQQLQILDDPSTAPRLSPGLKPSDLPSRLIRGPAPGPSRVIRVNVNSPCGLRAGTSMTRTVMPHGPVLAQPGAVGTSQISSTGSVNDAPQQLRPGRRRIPPQLPAGEVPARHSIPSPSRPISSLARASPVPTRCTVRSRLAVRVLVDGPPNRSQFACSSWASRLSSDTTRPAPGGATNPATFSNSSRRARRWTAPPPTAPPPLRALGPGQHPGQSTITRAVRP